MEPRTLHHLKSFPLVIPVGTWSSAHPAVLGCSLARDPFPWWKCSHGHQSLLLLPSLPSSRRGQLCPLSCPPETPSPAHPMPAHTRSREASGRDSEPGQLKIACLSEFSMRPLRLLISCCRSGTGRVADGAASRSNSKASCARAGPGAVVPRDIGHWGVTAASGLAGIFGGSETCLISWGGGY